MALFTSHFNIMIFLMVYQTYTPVQVYGIREPQVDKVHVVFMNHLDVGFDGIDPTVGFVSNVINKYFDCYFPRAVTIANDLINRGFRERFIYTTHPWLVYLYLTCDSLRPVIGGIPIHCPSESEKSVFDASIRRGNIAWHASAMNFQPEYFTELVFRLSLNISRELDNMFDINRKYATMSQRDVPGMTQAVVPILADMGVAAVSVGVSSSSPPPAFDSPIIWKFKENEVLAMWHKGGYPDPPGPNSTFPGGLSREDCVIVNGLNEALCFAFRGDNAGPPVDYKEVLSNFGVLREVFPGANVTASTFDSFVEALQTVKERLPVIYSEVGDTWIQGVGSDPLKNAMFRVFSDTLEKCYHKGECTYDDPRLKTAALWLVKLGEHTWGLKRLNDTKHWTNTAFSKAKNATEFINHVHSWDEQREFLDLALSALRDHPVAKSIQRNYEFLTPNKPDLNNYEPVPNIKSIINCYNGVSVQFRADGSLIKLYDPHNDIDWAGSRNPLGQFLYRTYNETDTVNFGRQYCYRGGTITGLSKFNMTENAQVESNFWLYSMSSLYRNKNVTSNCDFITVLTPVNSSASDYYGAPREVWIEYSTKRTIQGSAGDCILLLRSKKVTHDTCEEVDITVQLFNKTTTRLPEAASYHFQPILASNQKWKISKLGSLVDPMNVVLNGSQYNHATDRGVHFVNDSLSGLRFLSQDVPLVLVETKSHPPSLYPAPLQPIADDITGIAFNIFNNVWDTNFISWYPFHSQDKHLKARFKIAFEKGGKRH